MVNQLDDAVLMLVWVGSLAALFVVGELLLRLYEAYRKWRYQRLVRRYGCAIPKRELKWL